MSFDPYEFDRSYPAAGAGLTESQYTVRTFLWMVLGLMVTFGVAVAGWLTNATLYVLVSFPAAHLVVLVVTFILAITMTRRIETMTVAAAQGIFVAYAVLLGFTMSTWLYLYSMTSVVLVFLATALYFGVLAAYGYFTKRSLAGIGTILISGLMFLILFGLLSLVFPALAGDYGMFCLIGIAIFLGCTAYDTQRMRGLYYYYAQQPDMLEKAAIFSALQLYLDFINLFLYLLRFLGKNKN